MANVAISALHGYTFPWPTRCSRIHCEQRGAHAGSGLAGPQSAEHVCLPNPRQKLRTHGCPHGRVCPLLGSHHRALGELDSGSPHHHAPSLVWLALEHTPRNRTPAVRLVVARNSRLVPSRIQRTPHQRRHCWCKCRSVLLLTLARTHPPIVHPDIVRQHQ